MIRVLISLISLISLLVFLGGCGTHSPDIPSQPPHQSSLSAPSHTSPKHAPHTSVQAPLRRSDRVAQSIKRVRSAALRRAHLAPTARAASWALRSGQRGGRRDDARVVEPGDAVRVAVLLPLSGRYRRWGDEVKRAFERSSEIAPHVTWLFFDSEESRAVVASVIERAVNQDRVQAIVGPLEPDLATLASVRTRWHELPWFPLSSLPRALRHPLTFLWRLEAQDLAQGLASLICDREPREVYLLLDQRPRAQLTARHLLRRLRRCGVTRERYQIISGSRPKPAALDEVVRSLFMSDELSGQAQEQVQEQVQEQTVITLLREPLLSATLDALDRYDARARADRDQRDLEINVYAGLGARSLIRRATEKSSEPDPESATEFSWITRAFALERSALSDAGRRALKRYPDLSTLALEALDLARWLERATRRAQRRALPLSRALNDISRIDGVWGRRVIKRGQLMPAPLRVLR